MDIIVKGGEANLDPDLLRLSPEQESYVWRSPRPLYAVIGDRVYFAREGGNVYLYAAYGGYEQRTGSNNQGQIQSGPAILLTRPVESIDPPVRLPCHTGEDLGVGDTTLTIFSVTKSREHRRGRF